MKPLVINSFPRSGNVFLSTVVGSAFSLESSISALHLPEIFQVKEIYNVSIFRKPSDAISSLINKSREHTDLTNKDGQIDNFKFEYSLTRSIKSYISYLDAAESHFDNIQIVSFDDLSKDYKTVVEQISARYTLPINDGYEKNLVFDTNKPIWSDKFDGHLPREKDDMRLEIEKLVTSSEQINKLNSRYASLISRA